MSDPPSDLEYQSLRDMRRDKTQDFPPEIMAKIFTLACGGEVLIPPLDHGYPRTLGYICSRWRQILWNSPSIWNKIKVGHKHGNIPTIPTFGFMGGRRQKYSAGEVLSYILSNITTPVSLTVSAWGGYHKDVFSIILERLDRFVELSSDRLPEDTFISLLNLPQTMFTVLEKVNLLSFYIHELIPQGTPSPLETAPKLRSVLYTMASPTYVPSLFLLPWKRLEEIFVTTMCIPPDVLLDVFRHSPALVSCLFIIDAVEDISMNTEIMLPALKVLRLEAERIFSWDEFLTPLVTPALELFGLMSPQIPYAPLTSLIVRSHCPLRLLSIVKPNHDKDVSTNDLSLLLDHLPLLTHFTVPWFIPPSFFTKFHNGAFPNLAYADLEVHPEGLHAFLDMVDARVDSTQGCFSNFEIFCYVGHGFSAARDRYLASYQVYNAIEGLQITVRDEETGAKIRVEPDIGDAGEDGDKIEGKELDSSDDD